MVNRVFKWKVMYTVTTKATMAWAPPTTTMITTTTTIPNNNGSNCRKSSCIEFLWSFSCSGSSTRHGKVKMFRVDNNNNNNSRYTSNNSRYNNNNKSSENRRQDKQAPEKHFFDKKWIDWRNESSHLLPNIPSPVNKKEKKWVGPHSHKTSKGNQKQQDWSHRRSLKSTRWSRIPRKPTHPLIVVYKILHYSSLCSNDYKAFDLDYK